jgi:hypothetical protein
LKINRIKSYDPHENIKDELEVNEQYDSAKYQNLIGPFMRCNTFEGADILHPISTVGIDAY